MLTIKQAASYISNRNSSKRCHKTTVLRWIFDGCINKRTRIRVKLTAEQVGGQFSILEGDIEKFFKELNSE
jgi:hypothetical protein